MIITRISGKWKRGGLTNEQNKRKPNLTADNGNIDKLSAMLSCGHATARKIGEQAGAKIVIGCRVLYSVEKVKNYLSYLEE